MTTKLTYTSSVQTQGHCPKRDFQTVERIQGRFHTFPVDEPKAKAVKETVEESPLVEEVAEPMLNELCKNTTNSE